MEKFLVKWKTKNYNHDPLDPKSGPEYFEGNNPNCDSFEQAMEMAENQCMYAGNFDVEVHKMETKECWKIEPLPKVKVTKV